MREHRMRISWPGPLVALLLWQASAWADHPLTHIAVEPLQQPPRIDGRADDWPQARHKPGGGAEEDHAAELETLYSYMKDADDMALNADWQPRPTIRAGVYGERIYFLVQWHDGQADTRYKPWRKRGLRWRRGRELDDMLALRFELNGTFDSCMLSGATYSVDLWRWSAGRSDPLGQADDMYHAFSQQRDEQAAVHHHEGKTIYVRKRYDAGERGWRVHPRPKTVAGTRVSGIQHQGTPSGSVADVQAKGAWRDGRWTVEFSRALGTDDEQDVRFQLGEVLTGQLAFFDAGNQLRKQITDPLTFDLSGLR